ncbi:MAG: helix-turn-helix transcriptional regulator [Pseudobutyrivibrio sp.]|nr:helix-turn-helix transcriptional regulator [Pseudobutyrivibrio sp.]
MELAERIYVSRQTISSWENVKAKYQWILAALAAAVITFIVIVIMSMVAGFLFYN